MSPLIPVICNANVRRFALIALGITSVHAAPEIIVARPFPLSDVNLLDSPFRKAQELDRAYLLQLEPTGSSGPITSAPDFRSRASATAAGS